MLSRRLLLVGVGVSALAIMASSRRSGPEEAEAPDPLAADPAMAGRTRGFAQLCDSDPWVAATARTCGRVVTYLGAVEGRGSCILLDRFGTVALTTHQIEDWLSDADAGTAQATVRFSPRPGEVAETAGLADVRFHPLLDLAFATIDPAFVAQAGLAPAVWGTLPNTVAGTRIVAVGWALGHDQLHAAAGLCHRFHDIDQEEYTSLAKSGASGRFFCKVEARLEAHPGMSGGAVFAGGALVGLDNANGPADDIPNLRFTPSWALWDGYRKLYPARAALAEFAPGPRLDAQPFPLSCLTDPRVFSR